MSDLDSVHQYFRSEKCFFEKRGNQTLVSVPGEAVIVVLEGSGVHLWELLTKPKKADKLTSMLVKRYVVDEAQASKDVSDFLRQCVKAKIVVEESSR